MNSVRVQGVLVEIDGIGILLRGPAGIGKSLAALRLLDRGHCFVSDDLVEISVGPGARLWGRAIEKPARMELRGLGIFSVESLFPGQTLSSTLLGLVVDLDRYDPATDTGRIAPEVERAYYLGLCVPRVRMALASGVDPALFIDLLVRHLRHQGTLHS